MEKFYFDVDAVYSLIVRDTIEIEAVNYEDAVSSVKWLVHNNMDYSKTPNIKNIDMEPFLDTLEFIPRDRKFDERPTISVWDAEINSSIQFENDPVITN